MYGKKLYAIIAFIVVGSLLPVAGCKKKDLPPVPAARVTATKAFERYFGPAPTTDKGSCFAFVIYFPSSIYPGKAVPFPFFTFDEGSLKKVAVERLMGGMEAGSYAREFALPFPPGTRLLALQEHGGTVTASFSRELRQLPYDSQQGKASLNSLVLTLAQFPGVRDVRISVEGEAAVQKASPDEGGIMEPSSPRLLSVTAVKDKGAKNVEEVNAYFDRPVEIKELKMTDKSGNPLGGELFHSVFDMAAVLKPRESAIFSAGMPVKVHWQVVDKVGRAGAGDEEYSLEVKEH